jgi:hypothetical protein
MSDVYGIRVERRSLGDRSHFLGPDDERTRWAGGVEQGRWYAEAIDRDLVRVDEEHIVVRRDDLREALLEVEGILTEYGHAQAPAYYQRLEIALGGKLR